MVSRNRHSLCLLALFIGVNLIMFYSIPSFNFTLDEKLAKEYTSTPVKQNPMISGGYNYDSIDEILDAKILNYSTFGYFPQVYQPSLQATYYGLYILDKIGRISTINQTEITDFIMSHYNAETGIFMDDYSRRYLDINISKTFYPLTSVLEVHSYAILSLSILGRLDLINIQDMINFLWSCYNPSTSGFIGQPYNFILPAHFKLSTIDNTYFAIKTLDLLMPNWNGYQIEKIELIQYIIGLQEIDPYFWYFGGFLNDGDLALDTLAIFEPNLLSSYYSIAALDVFNAISSINISNFHQYLGGLYDSGSDNFQIAYFLPIQNYGDLVGTSLGLILSDLTSYTTIDRAAVVNYTLSSRNTRGLWNFSTDYLYYELIDTFQVVKSLSEAGELLQITEIEKDTIATSLTLFFMYGGFSLLSQDYTSINLLYNLINSFNVSSRLNELDFQYLYTVIERSCLYKSIVDSEGFFAGTVFEENYLGYRSYPIEYYLSGNQIYLPEAERILISHESTYMALDSLNLISKLGDFGILHDLNNLISSIVDSQFLEAGYNNYGGFLPFLTFKLGTIPYQNEKVFIEYSYYATRVLEILSEHLGLENISSLGFDVLALNTYIQDKIREDSSELYFDPGYAPLAEILIEDTYDAIYILKTLGLFDLDEHKIRSFVLNNVNYSNIRSVYYSYKISELLSINIPLNHDLIYNLIGNLYSIEEYDYFQSIERKRIDPEILYWISYMVENDLRFSTTLINITSLNDFIFLSSGNNITFSINSTYGGTYDVLINGTLLGTGTFIPSENIISYSLDSFSGEMGEHDVYINTTTIEGTTAEFSSTFYVYSTSETMVQILTLDNYEFMTSGNIIRFILSSDYPDWYNFSIDGIGISSGGFYDNELFVFSIDGYDVGDHYVSIEAKGLDGKEGFASATFTVYSTSETLITLYSIYNFLFNSTGNYVNFSISSDFPEWHTLKVDGVLLEEGPYISDAIILYLLDGVSSGLHTLSIWANSTDKKETYTNVQFSVFSNSFIEIEIRALDNYEFRTLGNNVRFFINSSFPDIYEFFIDDIKLFTGTYNHSGQEFLFSIDGYSVREHNLTIYVNSTDGKEANVKTSFTVYSLSNTIVNIEELLDYEFETTGHFLIFNISSLYPDYYTILIDGMEVKRADYISGAFNFYSIDGYEVGSHSLFIWAIGEDDKIGMASSLFNVYSNSTTQINVNRIPNYEFMKIGNFINFSISSMYLGTYNVSIDGILVSSDNYSIDNTILINSDGYSVGDHLVIIVVKSIDGKTAYYENIFSVYSKSSTIITIHALDDYLLNSTGNFLNFSIYSKYPDYYELWIDDTLISSDIFNKDSFIVYSLDLMAQVLGNHTIYIYAIGLDKKQAELSDDFTIYEGVEDQEDLDPEGFISGAETVIVSIIPLGILIFIPGTIIVYTYRAEHHKKFLPE